MKLNDLLLLGSVRIKIITYVILLTLTLLSPSLLFGQDSTVHASKFEFGATATVGATSLVRRYQVSIATSFFYCIKKNCVGLTYSSSVYPKFDDNDKIYAVDSGYGFSNHSLKLSYSRVLFEDHKMRNRLTLNVGATYLWGKLPYDFLLSPGVRVYAEADKGAIFSSGFTYYKKISGILWLTSSVDAGVRFISMKKDQLSLSDSKKTFNYYLGPGLAFRF